jgi:Ca-activated chloride channel family protein
VILLTDGEANSGIVTAKGLSRMLSGKNKASARVFSFGVGYQMNARLLERFSSVSGGSTVFVEGDGQVEAEVSEFFSRITSPVLSRPRLASSASLNRLSPKNLPELFGGSQIAVAGRYREGGKAEFILRGKEGKEDRTFACPFELADSPTEDAQFLRTVWARRRSAQIQEELDLGDFGKKGGESLRKELTDELLGIARGYGVLTPFTSFLAADPVDLNLGERNAGEALVRLHSLELTSGRDAVTLRRERIESAASLSLSRKPSSVKPRPLSSGRPGANICCDSPAGFAVDCCMFQFDAPPPAPGRFTDRSGGTNGTDGTDGTDGHEPEIIGARAFFLKGGVLTEGDLTRDELKSARTVLQFSEEYFKLASQVPQEGLGWLSQDKPLVFRFQGVVYRIEPEVQAKPEASATSAPDSAAGTSGTA